MPFLLISFIFWIIYQYCSTHSFVCVHITFLLQALPLFKYVFTEITLLMAVKFSMFISARVSLYVKICHVLLTPSASGDSVLFFQTHITHNNVCPHRFSSAVSLNLFCLFTFCFASHPTEVSLHSLRQPHKLCRGFSLRLLPFISCQYAMSDV
jgi:hypothetical protein